MYKLFTFFSSSYDNSIKQEKYRKVIYDFYNIQYIYCDKCIRNEKKSKLRCRMHYINNEYICPTCKSKININHIHEQDYVFDLKELKQYILEGTEKDWYFKIKALLLYWNQPKYIICNNDLLYIILYDIIEHDNFDELFKYDPYYLPV